MFKIEFSGKVIGVNHFYGYTNKKTFSHKKQREVFIPVKYVTREGKKYKENIQETILETIEKNHHTNFPLEKKIPCTVEITLFYKDGRSCHDLDNILKPILDSCEDLLFENDKQVEELRIYRKKKLVDGFSLFLYW